MKEPFDCGGMSPLDETVSFEEVDLLLRELRTLGLVAAKKLLYSNNLCNGRAVKI